jgi:hypothetical protein
MPSQIWGPHIGLHIVHYRSPGRPTAVWLERTQVCLTSTSLLLTMNSSGKLGLLLLAIAAYCRPPVLDASTKLGIIRCYVKHDVLSALDGYKRVTIDKAHGYNTTSLVCSDISRHSYYDSPDKRACGEGEEKKTSLTIVIRAEDW